MSTNYNDGLWHGWNGGECPVHPKTVVEVQHAFRFKGLAGNYDWRGPENIHTCKYAIIAFRVVKEFRDPREWWIVGGFAVFEDEADAHEAAAKSPAKSVVHVREVL